MSQVVSIRLHDEQVARLRRFARRAGKSQSEMGAQLIEESMREAEFAGIEFRNSTIGRQAHMRNSTLAVWEVIEVARDLGMDVGELTRYFNRPAEWVMAALHYYEAYRSEIETILEDRRAEGFDTLKRLLPQMEIAWPDNEGSEVARSPSGQP